MRTDEFWTTAPPTEPLPYPRCPRCPFLLRSITNLAPRPESSGGSQLGQTLTSPAEKIGNSQGRADWKSPRAEQLGKVAGQSRCSSLVGMRAQPGTARSAGSWLVFPPLVFQLIAPGGTMPSCSPRCPNPIPGPERWSPAWHAGR